MSEELPSRGRRGTFNIGPPCAKHHDGWLSYIIWFKPHNSPGDGDSDLYLRSQEAKLLRDSKLPSSVSDGAGSNPASPSICLDCMAHHRERDLFFVALESRTRTKYYISTFQLDGRTFLRNWLLWEAGACFPLSMQRPGLETTSQMGGRHGAYQPLWAKHSITPIPCGSFCQYQTSKEAAGLFGCQRGTKYYFGTSQSFCKPYSFCSL